jgi:predicted 2-oxoglutarate/Fe(II)-dependent dioxygenase YbiX
MVGEWCYFKQYFSKQVCDFIINHGKKIVDSHDGVIGSDVVDSSFRRSKVRFLHATDHEFNFIFEALWQTALQANLQFFNFHVTRLNFIQLGEYDSSYQGEYKAHHDVFWMNNDPHFHRKLSCVIQLSDPKDYDGGRLEIVEAGAPLDSDIIEQGTIIYFPSFLRHQVTPVTRGTRYSLVAWFEGPKWR